MMDFYRISCWEIIPILLTTPPPIQQFQTGYSLCTAILCAHLQQPKSAPWRYVCTPVSAVVWFTIAKRWNQYRINRWGTCSMSIQWCTAQPKRRVKTSQAFVHMCRTTEIISRKGLWGWKRGQEEAGGKQLDEYDLSIIYAGTKLWDALFCIMMRKLQNVNACSSHMKF